MNPQLLALLQLLSVGNQSQFNSNQQNPLLALLGGGQQQDPTQMLIAALSGVTGQQQNAINPQVLQALLGGGQSQPQQNDIGALLLQALAGGQQQQPQGGLDTSKLLELLQATNGKTKEKTPEELLAELLKGGKQESGEEDDIIAKLQKQFNKQNEAADTEADLADAIKFGLEFDKFVEENEDMLPTWFSVNEVKEDVEKWAKTPMEKAQGLAAATVRAFFKNEDMLELLEERDRNAVKDKILKDTVKSRDINRKDAWPLLERAIFNKGKLTDGSSPVAMGKDEQAVANYEARFKTGQQTAEQAKAANE
ncbi:TPA: hypothetical protein ACVU43_003023 [Vibrio parahaemolyticus]|nr:hypothetical protein [Vibrio parahaemolyticus]